MNLDRSIRWSAKTTYVNIDTGEIITNYNKQDYLKLKTKKHATVNRIKTEGTIEYTIECRKHPQTTIW